MFSISMQLAKSQQFERLYTLEMTKLQSRLEVSEMETLKLRERLQDESTAAAADIDKVGQQECPFHMSEWVVRVYMDVIKFVSGKETTSRGVRGIQGQDQ